MMAASSGEAEAGIEMDNNSNHSNHSKDSNDSNDSNNSRNSNTDMDIWSVFIISNREISNRASQILKANMLLICPYCLKFQIARV